MRFIEESSYLTSSNKIRFTLNGWYILADIIDEKPNFYPATSYRFVDYVYYLEDKRFRRQEAKRKLKI